MKRKAIIALWTLALCLCMGFQAAADAPAEAALPEGAVYCFSQEELTGRPELAGVLFTQVPQADRAVLRLGSRTLRAGDAVARRDLARLLVETRDGGEASLTYLPLEGERLGEETALTFHLERVEEEPPVARDQEIETWRDLPTTGTLRGETKGEGPLTFRLENHPRRGTVDLAEDGTFTYTPKKNKVGQDSFTFTVTDAAGRTSAPAAVRVNIRKPTDAQTYADLDRDAQFTALWLRETGLFGGEVISDRLSFGPDQTVSRGEFLAMLMDLEGIAPEIGLPASGFADEDQAPVWVRPYLASALRRGLVRGYTGPEGLTFRPNQPVTGAEAALMVSRALGLEELASAGALEGETAVPVWAQTAAAALAAARVDLAATDEALTRQQAADLLYQVSKIG